MKKYIFLISFLLIFISNCATFKAFDKNSTAGNPVFDGWYADPEGMILGDEYWIFPTFSARFDDQVFMDAFSSKDLVHWQKHSHVIDTTIISWATRAMWAPSVVVKDNKYYFFFGANDIQRPGGPMWNPNDAKNHKGGIGVAVADNPGGPYKDYLGKPLIPDFHNDAQPIDQFVYEDSDGTFYMIYGGWGHCNMAILNDDFTGFKTWDDGTTFKEITPKNYVEGPIIFKRNGQYYFMWSEGGWGNSSYHVAYAISDKITGPYERIGTILSSDEKIATGAGHNSVMNIPGTDEWYMVYHRRPIPNLDRDHRVTCIDIMEFNDDGTIKPIKMTFEGVKRRKIK